MTARNFVRRLLDQVKRQFGRDQNDRTTSRIERRDESPILDHTGELRFEPEDLKTRLDTLQELGLSEEEFVRHLTEYHGGYLKQQAFADYTDWSKATVSRVLCELEEEGHIERHKNGQKKIVSLSDNSPTTGSPLNREDDPDPTRPF